MLHRRFVGLALVLCPAVISSMLSTISRPAAAADADPGILDFPDSSGHVQTVNINGATQPGYAGMPLIELDGQGARIMRDVTREAVKRRMAVLLIEKGKPEVITAPVIQSELGARFQISGRMSTREANDLALLLRAGSLAAPMDIIEERTVGPSLGADNIKIGFHSTWIGFTAIAIFMIAYYQMFGVISVVALAFNVLFLVSLLSMLQATLTLPGMAGIALTALAGFFHYTRIGPNETTDAEEADADAKALARREAAGVLPPAHHHEEAHHEPR